MVVDYLRVSGIATFPSEQDAPLVVDSDGVTSRKLALERFQPIAGRDSQIHKLGGVMHKKQLAPRGSPELRRKLAYFLSRSVIEQILGESVAKAFYHGSDVIRQR